MDNKAFKAFKTFSKYFMLSVFIVISLLYTFNIIKTSAETIFFKQLMEFLNSIFLIGLASLLVYEFFKFIYKNDKFIINKRNMQKIVNKENIISIIRIILLMTPFVLIKLIKFILMNEIQQEIPFFVQILILFIFNLWIAFSLVLIYTLISYIYKKEWLIEENGDLDLNDWIDSYKPKNNENSDCDQMYEQKLENFIINYLKQIRNTIILKVKPFLNEIIIRTKKDKIPPIFLTK